MEYSAQRPGDVLAMQWDNFKPWVRWGDYEGPGIEIVQQKTGKQVQIPVRPKLLAVLNDLNASVVHIGGHIIAHPNGRRISQSRMGQLFRAVSEIAGLGHLQARDLRRTACVRIGEAGGTAIEVAATSGHTIQYSTNILETYLPRNAAMAWAGMHKLEQKEAKESNAFDSEGV
jgi:integrase